ncbi:hypothetical protein [Mycobacterium sp. E1747]|uniref:hypothetical protein n=1 Tax=Mycobacterium sp. E1747 TaxID=1834128 RepID=UPI0007FF091A|nr:hypothetical protein [Mycobacterium sp. E1747]OBH08145.1 hypothetical protein A5695_26590 [Mycobacterium sp. E1747]
MTDAPATIDEFRSDGGTVSGQFENADLLLTTTAAKSGQPGVSQLACFRIDTITGAAPGFAEYQSKTSRVIPLFELQRT